MKSRSLKVSLSYGTFLMLLLAFACQKAAREDSVANDEIPCDESVARFEIPASAERLNVSELPEGVYEYSSGEVYFRSDVDARGVHARETITAAGSANAVKVKSAYVCRQGFVETADELDVSETAPRTLLLREGGVAESYIRKFRLYSQNKFPAYQIGDVGNPSESRHALVARLAQSWDEETFVHSGFKTYTLYATKRTLNGTLRIRVDYVKPDSKILEEGDIFFPFPNSNAF